jgi:ferric-dicitrate binding protein FerR (iron transport regulator)
MLLNQNETERIERYVSGTADINDVTIVEAMFSQGQEDTGLRNHLAKDWESDHQNTVPSEQDLNRLLDHVHHTIRNKEYKKRKLFFHRLSFVYSKVAAIFLLPLVIGAMIFSFFEKLNNPDAEQLVSSVIHAPMGSRVSFKLPDGTVGWLNSGSNLTYSLPFNNNRKITLDGEAWFDVAHNEKNPFEINAGGSKVKVIGTSFNVCAFRGTQHIEVVLQNGKVEFYPGDQSQEVTMAPSQKLVFNDGKIELTMTDPSKYKSWTDGKLVFRGDDMIEVARRIERWYNVKVILADDDLKGFSFRATFEDDSLEEVLHLLSLTSPISYKITPRIMKPDGTYEKMIVTLSYKRAIKKSNNPKQN